jgi:hypothetical protein
MKFNTSSKPLIVLLSALLVSLYGCGGKIYDYELERIAKICGGYENIKNIWNDVSTARARCIDDKLVSAKD